jgi:hypothetical protein
MGRTSQGYGMLWVGSREDGNHYGVHRLSAYIHLELDLDSPILNALHKLICKYRNCWNPNCLYVGTQSDNGRDYRESRKYCKSGHSLKIHGYITRRHRLDTSKRLKCRECARIARNKHYNKHKNTINQKRRQKP